MMVAIPVAASFSPDENYNFSHSKYDEKTDTYTCPAKVLTTNENWYQKKRGVLHFHS